MTSDKSETIDAWTAYWRTGSGASCLHGADAEVRLAQIWDEYVDHLPDRARILDLATGNGTVAAACAAGARARKIDLTIEAVDAAAIDPRTDAADPAQLFRDVRFHAGVLLEALPFPDGVFQGAVSQFGFEYADEERAAAEVIRVLAAGGRLRLVTHARDGAVSRDISLRLERLRGVLAENGPVTLVRALTRAAETGDGPAVNHLSRQLAAAAELLHSLVDHPPQDDAALFYSSEFLQLWARRDRFHPTDLHRSVEDGWINANGVAIRQQEMLRVARTSEDMAALGARFTAAGLAVNAAREIRNDHQGVQIAWQLDVRKPG